MVCLNGHRTTILAVQMLYRGVGLAHFYETLPRLVGSQASSTSHHMHSDAVSLLVAFYYNPGSLY